MTASISLPPAMTASPPNYIDARRSNFHNIGRDQNNFLTYNLTLNLLPDHVQDHVQYSARKRPRDNDIYTISVSTGNFDHDDKGPRKRRKVLDNTDTPPLAGNVAVRWPSGSAGEAANQLIVQIMQLLIDRGETGASDYHRRLELELEFLRQTLTLTNLAIQTFEYTPLGQNLGQLVVLEVDKICVVLQKLYDGVNCYREGLWPTSIYKLWRKVWRRGCEMDDEVTSLRASQHSLGAFLMSLHS